MPPREYYAFRFLGIISRVIQRYSQQSINAATAAAGGAHAAGIAMVGSGQAVQTAAGQSVTGNLAAFRALRAQEAALGHTLKLDISLGGWTKSTHFSTCAKTSGGRASIEPERPGKPLDPASVVLLSTVKSLA